MKMQKILIFPLIVVLMLSSILVASRYVSEAEGNKDDVSGEAAWFTCRVDAKCLFLNCLKSGACDRCCKSHGWVRGKCRALDCNCCIN
ncbi:unnamed protein product [Miscanthus lutarioriparius]|uniref:Uncharacterized protein n=1 Tax=Miscanthus lutarioriparius TaxID=422564 RepID=A0A811PXT1_9POAL|nr:unnamed protein product [Miscanthus lutarioriparius]CAD6248377.1 unnamed protein product [Miscanthus lutarioriparius]